MRHNKKINHLGRTHSHRDAMLSNMACSLIKHKRIFTTVPKAKELRQYVEPLITKCKEDTTHSRRTVFKYLRDKIVVTELFKEVSQKIGDRPGGYTRIIKTGYRMGDNAAMCFIELVDYNDNMLKDSKAGGKAKTRRSRKKGDVVAPVAEVKAPKAPRTPKIETNLPVEEIPVVEEAVVEAPTQEEAPVAGAPADEVETPEEDASEEKPSEE